MIPTDDILADVRGRLGVVTLNRPKVLNALTLAMVEQLAAILTAWAADPAIDAVLLQGTGRAFCAGADVRAIGTLAGSAAREQFGRVFFRSEYRLNQFIHTYPKPFIAVASGIVMGGGMGLSVHGAFRIVTETTQMAMPETVLGLFPDVGAVWFLARCPGSTGMFLGLTGARVNAADAVWSGLATHVVASERIAALIAALAAQPALTHGALETVIGGFARHDPPASTLPERSGAIDRLFGGDQLEHVITALESAPPDGWEAEALALLRRASPLSLRATWRRLRAAGGQTIETVLADDYRMAVRLVAGHDFAEGVRAILIDKDNAPQWLPPTLAQVDEAQVDALLAPLLG
jgi:enoyl-CoA hydratase